MLKRILEYLSSKAFKDIILEQIKGKLFKIALKKAAGTFMGSGLGAFFLKLAIKNLFKEFIAPITKAALVEVGYGKDTLLGKDLNDKLEGAESAGDNKKYDSIVDDIYS